MPLRTAQEVHVADDAGKAPFVLVFEIGAGAPFLHDHVQTVFPFAHEGSDVELAHAVRDLRKTDKISVDVYVKTGINPFKDKEKLLPRLRGKSAAVMIGRILHGHARRIEGNGIADVRVLKKIIPEILYTGGHGNTILKLRRAEIFRHVFQFLIRGKLPLPVQREEPSALFPAPFRLPLRKRYVITARHTHAESFRLFAPVFDHTSSCHRSF